MKIRKNINRRKKRTEKILKELKKIVPDAEMILKYKNNWELLVAVILSAQCTDKKVNEVTEKLFKKYRKLEDYVKVSANRRTIKEFEEDIYATGFYKNKTKNILSAARYIKSKYGGKIPKTMEEILTIPGVGRKTANVVLGNAYGVVEGIAVDTHVFRLAHVLELSDGKTTEMVERDLMNLFPKMEWFKLTYYLIEYGRRFCPARKHNHKNCPLSTIL